jgi:hypothetical protein
LLAGSKEVKVLESGGGSEEDLADSETGLELIESVQGNRMYRERVWCGHRERIGCRKVSSIYQCAHRNYINPLKYWD